MKDRIAAIIPAYNEEKNIGRVLASLKACDRLSEIIVVDDGSRDLTAEVARTYGVSVVQQENQGKGAAMCAGAAQAQSPIIFFCDADLVGLTPEHIEALIDPVVANTAGMTVGIRDRGELGMWLMRHIFPLIGGERAMRREMFQYICAQEIRNFGIETAMNAHCRKNNILVKTVSLIGVRHILKEQKYGFVAGFIARVKMIGEVIAQEIKTLFS